MIRYNDKFWLQYLVSGGFTPARRSALGFYYTYSQALQATLRVRVETQKSSCIVTGDSSRETSTSAEPVVVDEKAKLVLLKCFRDVSCWS